MRLSLIFCVCDFQSMLPHRVLQEGDQPPDIPDLPKDTNRILFMINAATLIDRQTGNHVKSVIHFEQNLGPSWSNN